MENGRVEQTAGVAAMPGCSDSMAAVDYLGTRDMRGHVIERVLLGPYRHRAAF